MLDGIPEIYRKFFVVPKDNSINSLYSVIKESFKMTKEERKNKYNMFNEYIKHLYPLEVANKIWELINA